MNDLEYERETIVRILNLCEREKHSNLARKIEALVEKRDESGQSDEEYLAKESL
jgi:hypothetical protein